VFGGGFLFLVALLKPLFYAVSKGSQALDGRLLKVYVCIVTLAGVGVPTGFTGFFSGAPAGGDHLPPARIWLLRTETAA